MWCTQNMQFNLAMVKNITNWKLFRYAMHVSDVMLAYNRISQAEDESVSQYLICVKEYLQWINHISRLASMDGSGLNHICLVQGLSDNYIRRRASKDAENWKTMANAFDSIAKIGRTAGKTKPYNEPRYEKPTDINAISNSFNNSQKGSFNRYQGTYRSNHVNSRNNSQNNPHQAAGNNPPRQESSKEPVCYHFAGPHYITKCAQYQKDKDKYKCTTQQVKQNLWDKLKLGARKNSISINVSILQKWRRWQPWQLLRRTGAEELCQSLDTDSGMTKHKGSTCEQNWWWYQPDPIQSQSKWPASNSTLLTLEGVWVSFLARCIWQFKA